MVKRQKKAIIDWDERPEIEKAFFDEEGDQRKEVVDVDYYDFQAGDQSVQVHVLKHPTHGVWTFGQGDEAVGGSTGWLCFPGRVNKRSVMKEWCDNSGDGDDDFI